MAFQNKNTKRLSDSDAKADKRAEKEIEVEEILAEASETLKKQMDAEGIFVSEGLIAAATQRIWQSKEADTTQIKTWKRQTIYKKQLGRIAVLAAAVFAMVLLAGNGTGMLSGSKGLNPDDAEMFQMEGNGLDGCNNNSIDSTASLNHQATEPAGAETPMEFNNAPPPSDLWHSLNGDNIETTIYLQPALGKEETMLVLSGTEEISGCLASKEGVEPQLLYQGKAFLALKVTGVREEALQIVFDEPQDFLYSCGREGECFYLLVTRRTASGGYEHRLLLFDFGANQAEALELPKERDGLVSWISLQDGTVVYECN